MKNNSVVMNMGHGNMEIDTDFLLRSNECTLDHIHDSLDKITLKTRKNIYLLAAGYLVNLVGGNGHPPRVMSITYTNHLLALLEMIKSGAKFNTGEIYRMPRRADEFAARLNLPEISAKLTILTPEQELYLGIQKEGPFKREDYRY